MFKKIEIDKEVIVKVKKGKYVDGSIRIDATTGQLTFVAYNHLYRGRKKSDILIKPLEHGWLKESPERYKFYQSIPKNIGVPCVLGVLDRETSLAKIELKKIGD